MLAFGMLHMAILAAEEVLLLEMRSVNTAPPDQKRSGNVRFRAVQKNPLYLNDTKIMLKYMIFNYDFYIVCFFLPNSDVFSPRTIKIELRTHTYPYIYIYIYIYKIALTK